MPCSTCEITHLRWTKALSASFVCLVLPPCNAESHEERRSSHSIPGLPRILLFIPDTAGSTQARSLLDSWDQSPFVETHRAAFRYIAQDARMEALALDSTKRSSSFLLDARCGRRSEPIPPPPMTSRTWRQRHLFRRRSTSGPSMARRPHPDYVPGSRGAASLLLRPSIATVSDTLPAQGSPTRQRTTHERSSCTLKESHPLLRGKQGTSPRRPDTDRSLLCSSPCPRVRPTPPLDTRAAMAPGS